MAQLFHIPCLLYFGVLGGTPNPENFCQKVYWATLLYKQKQSVKNITKSIENTSHCAIIYITDVKGSD